MQILETPRLNIRTYTESDVDSLFTILSGPATMAFWPSPFTRLQTEHWLQRAIQSYKDNGFGRWAVELNEGGHLIGDVGIMNAEIDGKIEHDLGYIIHSPFWNQGYAVEAAQACSEYGFRHLSLTRLCANIPHNHTGSRRVAEKIGMKYEKAFVNRRNRDILTYLFAKEISDGSV